MWAILSGIEGNIAAYEAVLADIKRQRVPLEFRLKGEQKSSKERKEKKREKMKIGQKSTCSPP